MRIDRIELYLAAMPLIYPWRTAYGEDATIHTVFCRMVSGSLDAWGESTPLAAPCYSPEWAGGVFETARNWLAPAIIGKQVSSGDELQSLMSIFKGNYFAKGLLDSAWWSLFAKQQGRPLHQLFGATRDWVSVGDDFGVKDSIGDLLDSIAGAVEGKFPRVKLKFRPGWDLPMLREVKKRYPETTFHIDCNSGYRLTDLAMFQELDQFGLAMWEQPLQHDDLLDHAELQKRVKTPVCLDESVTGVRVAEQAVALGSCRYVNIKPARVGGLTNALKIHHICKKAGIPCWVGGMLESSTGVGQCIALAMLDNFTYPADIFPSARYYVEDVSEPATVLTQGPDQTPGVQALASLPEPVPSRLLKRLVTKAEFLA